MFRGKITELKSHSTCLGKYLNYCWQKVCKVMCNYNTDDSSEYHGLIIEVKTASAVTCANVSQLE